MSHLGTASLVAAGAGALFAALVVAVVLATRRLPDPPELEERPAALVAASGLLSGWLFALLGARGVGRWLSLTAPTALLLTLCGTLAVALIGVIVLRPVVYRYLRWARPPSVLREERDDGFGP